MSFVTESIYFLVAAIIAVPICKRLGLGSVLGYLLAGVIIGPLVLGLIEDAEGVQHTAELGVVLLLYIIGLELKPERLWLLRRGVFGVGGAQVVLTAAALMGVAWAFGQAVGTTIVIGLALAMSSTAFALQMLAERSELTTAHGRSAFGILLFQDLAVIPVLAIVPLLGAPNVESSLLTIAPIPEDPIWWKITEALLVIAGVYFVGRYLLRYVLRIVARTYNQELFTALALLTVLGTALLMEAVGLSMALGGFMAGVLLADSEYRHQLEADIEPFKGLLLALFFIATGMLLKIEPVIEQPLFIAALVIGLIGLKGIILYGVGRAGGLQHRSALFLAGVLCQGGEFAFVIFSQAITVQAIPESTRDLLVVVVTLSMALTPLIVLLLNLWLAKESETEAEADREQTMPDTPQVIIAGFGRFGQMTGRVLAARHIPFTALEKSAEQVDYVQRFGNEVYYGDPARIELLRAAHAAEAKILVIAVDDVERSVKIAEMVRKNFPKLTVIARARNRQHVYRLMEQGVKIIRRETFASALEVADEVLQNLGFTSDEAARTIRKFRKSDESRLADSFDHWQDEEQMMEEAKQAAEEIRGLFRQDAEEEILQPIKPAKKHKPNKSARQEPTSE